MLSRAAPREAAERRGVRWEARAQERAAVRGGVRKAPKRCDGGGRGGVDTERGGDVAIAGRRGKTIDWARKNSSFVGGRVVGGMKTMFPRNRGRDAISLLCTFRSE